MFSRGPWVVLSIGVVCMSVVPPNGWALPIGALRTPKINQQSNRTVDMDAVLNKVMMDFLQMLNRQKTTPTTATTFAARGIPPEPPRAQFLREAENHVVENIVTAPPMQRETIAYYAKTHMPLSSMMVTRSNTTLGITKPHSFPGSLINKYTNVIIPPRAKVEINSPNQPDNIGGVSISVSKERQPDVLITPNVTINALNSTIQTISTTLTPISTGNNKTKGIHFMDTTIMDTTITSTIMEKTSLTTPPSAAFVTVTENNKWTHKKASSISKSDNITSTVKPKTTPVLKTNISGNRASLTLPSLTLSRFTTNTSSVMAGTTVDVAKTTTPVLVTKSRETVKIGSVDRSKNRRNSTTRFAISPVCVLLTAMCLLIGRTVYS